MPPPQFSDQTPNLNPRPAGVPWDVSISHPTTLPPAFDTSIRNLPGRARRNHHHPPCLPFSCYDLPSYLPPPPTRRRISNGSTRHPRSTDSWAKKTKQKNIFALFDTGIAVLFILAARLLHFSWSEPVICVFRGPALAPSCESPFPPSGNWFQPTPTRPPFVSHPADGAPVDAPQLHSIRTPSSWSFLTPCRLCQHCRAALSIQTPPEPRSLRRIHRPLNFALCRPSFARDLTSVISTSQRRDSGCPLVSSPSVSVWPSASVPAVHRDPQVRPHILQSRLDSGIHCTWIINKRNDGQHPARICAASWWHATTPSRCPSRASHGSRNGTQPKPARCPTRRDPTSSCSANGRVSSWRPGKSICPYGRPWCTKCSRYAAPEPSNVRSTTRPNEL